MMGWDLLNNTEEEVQWHKVAWRPGCGEWDRADQEGQSHSGAEHKGLGFYSVGKATGY